MTRPWITFYVGFAFAVLGSAHLDAAELIRISQTAAGEPSDRSAYVASMTPDGRYVVIASFSSNLVPGLSPSAHPNLYVYDVGARSLELVSVRDNGKPAGNHSIGGGSISADGRYVVFSASDLQAVGFVRGDTNHKPDLFLRDRLRGTTVMLTKSPSGGVANGASRFGLITGDGHTVVLQSTASNLTAGGSAKQSPILSLNLDTHQFARLHLASGSQVPNASSTLLSISNDGRFVAFSSSASNLVAGDRNGVTDFFVRDRTLGATELLMYRSRWPSAGGRQRIGGTLSGDGRYFGFQTNFALSVVDPCQSGGAYLYDRAKSTQSCVSIDGLGKSGNHPASFITDISMDARFVAFESSATNLVPGDTNAQYDVFIRDRQDPTTTLRVSVSATGVQGNSDSRFGKVSSDGRTVTFTSAATDLIPGIAPGPFGQGQVYLLR